jgi:hypothetical protein
LPRAGAITVAQWAISALEQAIVAGAERFYLADTRYPAHYEPGGDEYISGALTEALLMSKVEDFPAWFDAFLPEVGAVTALMNPAEVSDRTDPKIAHLDGLNLSRAWCMKHIASAFRKPSGAAGAARGGDETPDRKRRACGRQPLQRRALAGELCAAGAGVNASFLPGGAALTRPTLCNACLEACRAQPNFFDF